MTPHDLIAAFETLADAPDGVTRLRELVLQLAVRGKLVPQHPEDEPASVLLERVAAESLPDANGLDGLTGELQAVNTRLWEIEDSIRDCEAAGDFGPQFVELARAVYIINDRRSEIKRRINMLLGSAIVEEKSYADYGAGGDT